MHFSLKFLFGMHAQREKEDFKNITMNEWERTTGDEVISVLGFA
jgi:hypothetical protein